MAKICLVDGSAPDFMFSALMLDEFIPLVEFDKSKYDQKFGYLSGEGKLFSLSKYIDDTLRDIEPKIVETDFRKIKLSFNVRKGFAKSRDPDGIIDIKFSVDDAEIQLVGDKSISSAYQTSFELAIEIKKKMDIEFYIDFFAKDDSDDEFNKGELTDVHCGRIKVVFKYTVTTDWYTIPSVIPMNKFIGWLHPGVEQNCFSYVVEQLKQVGHQVKSGLWNKGTAKKKELNDNVIL